MQDCLLFVNPPYLETVVEDYKLIQDTNSESLLMGGRLQTFFF